MRLEADDDARAVALGGHLVARGGEHRVDLGRVVGVVIVDAHAVEVAALDLAAELEAAAHAGKVGEPLPQLLRVGAGKHASEQRGRGVEHHVAARDTELIAHRGGVFGHVQLHSRRDVGAFHRFLGDHGAGGDVGVGRDGLRGAVAKHVHAPGGGALTALGCVRVVQADHEVTAGLDAVGEVVEDLEVRLVGFEEVEVVGLDVGNHRDVRLVAKQRRVRLVRLGHEHVAGSVMGVRAGAVELTANGEGGVHPGRLQRHHRHGRGGGLAVRPGEEHLGVALHELAKQVGAADHRDSLLCGAHQLRVVLGDRGEAGHHDGRELSGKLEVFARVADGHLRALQAQRADRARLLHVRTGDHGAAVEQDVGHAGHAGAADADEVDAGEVDWGLGRVGSARGSRRRHWGSPSNRVSRRGYWCALRAAALVMRRASSSATLPAPEVSRALRISW